MRAFAMVLLVALLSACGSDNSGTPNGKGGSGGHAGASGGSGGTSGGSGGSGGTSGSGGSVGGSGGSVGGSGGSPGCNGIAPPPQSGGTTYFVSPSGSDSNAGTQAAPFATIQKGVDSVAPGDTVVVMDGTYTGVAGNSVVSITQGGSANNWVWVHAEHKWQAVIDGQGTASDGISLSGDAGYIRVQGFEVKNVAIDGSTTGITCYGGGHDSEIVENHIHDIGRVCTDTSNGLCAIFVQQPNVTVEANVIHDIGRYGPGENGCTPTNQYWQNHDHGIYADGNAPGASGLLVKNNVFYNLAHGWAVQIYPGTLDGVRIVNNTFATPNPNKDGHIVLDATISNLTIENNIFYQPTTAALDVSSTTFVNTVVDNNLTDAPAMLDVSSTPAGMTLASNLTGTDPILVNPSGGDFHVQAASPAIDAGKNEPDVPLDMDGCARPGGSGWDIGADEITP